jgi:hypothetical protein
VVALAGPLSAPTASLPRVTGQQLCCVIRSCQAALYSSLLVLIISVVQVGLYPGQHGFARDAAFLTCTQLRTRSARSAVQLDPS